MSIIVNQQAIFAKENPFFGKTFEKIYADKIQNKYHGSDFEYWDADNSEYITFQERNWKTHKGMDNASWFYLERLKLNERLQARNGYAYIHWAVIANRCELTIDQIKVQKATISRRLKRAGIVAVVIPEVTKKNKIHYNLVTLDRIDNHPTPKQLKTKMKQALDGMALNVCVDDFDSTIETFNYIFKARVDANGETHIYKKKRVAFSDQLTIRHIGQTDKRFWALPVYQLDRMRRQETKDGKARQNRLIKAMAPPKANSSIVDKLTGTQPNQPQYDPQFPSHFIPLI